MWSGCIIRTVYTVYTINLSILRMTSDEKSAERISYRSNYWVVFTLMNGCILFRYHSELVATVRFSLVDIVVVSFKCRTNFICISDCYYCYVIRLICTYAMCVHVYIYFFISFFLIVFSTLSQCSMSHPIAHSVRFLRCHSISVSISLGSPLYSRFIYLLY